MHILDEEDTITVVPSVMSAERIAYDVYRAARESARQPEYGPGHFRFAVRCRNEAEAKGLVSEVEGLIVRLVFEHGESDGIVHDSTDAYYSTGVASWFIIIQLNT